MSTALAGIQLIGGWLPIGVDLAAAALLLWLVGWLLSPKRQAGRRGRGIVVASLAAIAGAALGLALCWLLSDQLDLFEVSLTPTSRAWVAGAFAAVGVAIAVIAQRGRAPDTASARDRVRARFRSIARRSVAAFAATMAVLAGTLGVNADFGQYTTIGSLADTAIAAPFPSSVLAAQLAGAPGTNAATSAESSRSRALWRTVTAESASGASLPARGLVGAVTIPATVSHFAAREAYVYLPPAALSAHPVALPVLIMMSGQPGSPANVIASGQIAALFDVFARAHGGLAPIVVVPDQLGAPGRNPMCVNGALGASESYLTVDVPNWIRSHLTVQPSPAAWAIGGFSQGGTCSIQLGAAHPELFSAIVDISGQLAPKNGGLAQTVALGFGGDPVAYRAATPEAVLARNAPYRRAVAVFGVGQLDSRYGPVAAQMTAAARDAGIAATEAISPGTGHDWHTVQWVLEHAMAPIYQHLGLARVS